MALRLARFNTHSVENFQQFWMEGLATGVPAPAGAYLLLMPIMIKQWLGWVTPAWINACWSVFISFLLVSRIPTFLLKKKKTATPSVQAKNSVTKIMAFLLFLGCAYSFTWATLVFVGIGYCISIIFSAALASKRKKAYSLSQN